MNTPQEFGSLLAGLHRLADSGFAQGGGALATLTQTSGSTFRRAGARMLVCGDGTVVRGLSGGCPEADIIGRAREVIAEGIARIVRYDRESGLDALLELGCGGELEVLIEPLTKARDLDFIDAAADCLAARRSGVLATVYRRDGAVMNPKPRRMVIDEGRIVVNEFGAGLISGVLADLALDRLPITPSVERFTHGGNAYEVLLEALIPPYALFIVGINAGAVALARIAAVLGWQVTLVDDRDDRGERVWSGGLLPDKVRRVTATPQQITEQLDFDARSFAVVMTHNLGRDIDYLRALGDVPLAYLGSLGSRQRAARLYAGSGLSAEQLRAPAGLDLGSETPEEIALAISAEILAVTSGRAAESLSQTTGPIHA
ncbi:XdhC family protein [Nevskia sp.]|uniref:XdhC family protein n=1 Tax=Nevskia sp. TaxID=1929292 RepID=UPI0025D3E703|nr:XdhC/CoxI family protein [Nevskia sp.]